VENNRRVNWPFGIGVTVGVTVGLVVSLAIGRRGRMQRMPRLDAWQRALAEQWGEAGAAMLASRVLAKYQALYAWRPHFARRVLQSHLERDILPGLALYRVMLEETGTEEDALAEMEDLFKVTSARNRVQLPFLGCSSDPCRFHLNVLAAYGTPELAAILCREAESPGLNSLCLQVVH
jgi:hypothetical protein